MIHGKSTDPVFIKKIKLKIWTLRDEIEAVILKATEKKGSSLTKEEKELLIEEYSQRVTATPGLQVIEGGAGAQAEGETEDEGGEPEQTEEEKQQAAADAMLAAMDGEDIVEGGAQAPESGSSDQGVSKEVIQRGSQNIPEDKITHGIVVLSELGMDHLYFFSNKNFTEGQSIVVEFQVPKRFIVNINVAYSRAFNMKSRIISEKKLPYRVVGSFSFLKEGERTLLRQFVASIEPEVQEEVVVKKKAASGDDDDDGDFGDLDDLI
ncbi:MAG: hypothetical protein GY909_17685 [Oligoflexia bacterium]|nr:hypothetical protein [Oligoflexia bacterium]